MEAKNILDVEKFVVASNDMLSGKFLDLNKRLEKFLSVMTKSEDILALLSECIENFDEEVEFTKAFSLDKNGEAIIDIPTDDHKRLALSVTIFNNIANKKLNATQFLDTYFQTPNQSGLQRFLDEIIKPFRDIICKIFELQTDITIDDIKKQIEAEKMEKEESDKKAEQEQFPHLNELLAEIEKTCNQILALLKFEKKRTDELDDVEFIISSILEAKEKRDLMVINGLVIGLNYASKKFKNVRHLINDLNNSIYDYYEFLAGESN